MSESKNEFEYFMPYEIDDLESFQIADTTNKVLIQVFPEDTDETIGGIQTKGLDTHSFARYTGRRGKVIKTCERIVPTRNCTEFTMWQTDIEIMPGDEVWLNFFDKLHSYDFRHKDMYLKLVPYASIICARRDGKTIMCNGYVLIERYVEEVKYIERVIVNEIYNQGIIKYVGKPNKRYYLPILSHDKAKYIEKGLGTSEVYGSCDGHFLVGNKKKNDPPEGTLKKGQRVVIGQTDRLFDLEEYAFAFFEDRKVYRVCQQYNIIAIIE
jgi:hypothetical protein